MNRRSPNRHWAIIVAMAAVVTTSAFGQFVTITAHGTITSVESQFGATAKIGDLVPVGTPFTATWNLAQSADSDPQASQGNYQTASTAGSFSANGYTFLWTTGISALIIYNSSVDGTEVYSTNGGTGNTLSGLTGNTFRSIVYNSNTSIFSSDAITGASVMPQFFSAYSNTVTYNLFSFIAYDTTNHSSALYGSVSSFTVSAIPEPSTYVMVAGVMALGFAVWRRARARA